MKIGYEVFHQDVETLVDFYVNALGFSATDRTDDTDYVGVSRGAVRVGCTKNSDAPQRPENRPPPHGSEIVLYVDNLADEAARVTAAGWPLADPPQLRPWGVQDFRVFDPSGQYIRITETTRNAPR